MKRPFLRFDNPVWALFASFIFLLVFSWSTSPLYLTYGDDSPFFQIIGLGVLQGKIPYVDLFDHKGPLIFFADTLGYSLGLGKTGLFILQVLSFSVALGFFFKIARLFTKSDKRAFFAVALSLIPLIDFIIEGNQCEEWMLPWEAAAVYIAFKYLLGGEERFAPWKSLLFGVIFAVLFYIRPNDGVMWIGGMYFGLFLLWIVRRRYSQIAPGIACFAGGALAVSVPIWAYFIAHDAVHDFIFGMIVHNVKYAADEPFTWGGIGMIIIPVIIIGALLLAAKKAGNKDFRFLLIPVLVLVVAFIGKRDYYHYLMPLMPFIVTCFTSALERGWKVFLWIVCVLFGLFSFREWKCVARAVQARPDLETLYEQTDALFDYVPEEEQNDIWNYNLFTYRKLRHSPHMYSLVAAYLHKLKTPSNAAFVFFQMDYCYPESEYGVRAGEPKWVLMTPAGDYFNDVDYIYDNYELVASTPSEPVCEIRLYKRK